MHRKISRILHLSSLQHVIAKTNGLIQSRMESSSYSSIRCNLIHNYTIVIHLQILYILNFDIYKNVVADTNGLMQSRKDSSSYSGTPLGGTCNPIFHGALIHTVQEQKHTLRYESCQDSSIELLTRVLV